MKRIAVCLLFFYLCCGFVFAETKWFKSNDVDDFGDPTGHFSVSTDYLSGTYKNQSTSSGKLTYRIAVRDNGSLLIYLFEDGKSKDVTTTSSGAYYVNAEELFKIQIKYGNGTVITYYGGLKKDSDYKYDLIYVSNWYNDFRYDLINENTLKIVVSASNGSYSLGAIDTSDITDKMFFDSTLYDEGLRLQGLGKYQDAVDKFNELKTKNKEAYDFYKAEDCIKECQTELGKAVYDEAKALMYSGEFQQALTNLDSLENQYPDCYKSLKAEALKSEIKKKAGIYYFGDVGPAGGYIFYDKGYTSDGWRYLEAAPSDINQYSVWGDDGEYGTQTGIGTGKTNTAIIVSKASNSRKPNAATLCNDYTYGGYDDWFLPSIDELNLMYNNLNNKGQGGFDYSNYWSSSEGTNSSSDAWEQRFSNGNQSYYSRGNGYRVRPVRAF